LIRVDNVWLAVEPLDMRSGTQAALAGVVNVFGAARPYLAYLFANRRANRMKVLVHDGIGVWLAARRLNSGRFVWPTDASTTLSLMRGQVDGLVLGLPWQRIGEAGVISVLQNAAVPVAQLPDVPMRMGCSCGTITIRDRRRAHRHAGCRATAPSSAQADVRDR
jgi:transposase